MSGQTDLIIVKVDKARMLLAEARDATGAKHVADLARAAEIYAKRQQLSEEAVAYATAVKIDALTLMGEFLKGTEKNKGANGRPGGGTRGSHKEPRVNPPPTLSSAGIGKKESSAAQALAELKDKAPEMHEAVRNGKHSVQAGINAVRNERKRVDLEAKAAAAPASSGTWEVRHGDCLEQLAKIDAGSIDLIVTDPPYNIGIDYGDGTKADKLPGAEYVMWCGQWIQLCYRALKPDGTFWLIVGDEYADYLGLELHAADFHRRAWVKWYETFGVNTSNNFNRCSRHLFYSVKDAKRFTFHASAVNRPSDRQTKYEDKRADPGGKIWDDVWEIPRLVGTAKERIPDFPTQLPLALVEPIVLCCSDPGGLVLDPFSGSATVGVAAIVNGRRFVGIEKQKKFVELASKRLKVASHERT